MAEDDLKLKGIVDAFSKILEYSPFCKYGDEDVFTYEWDKVNPDERFNELSNNPSIVDLVRI